MSFRQHIFPHIVAYLLFLGTVLGFFSPIFFQGKKLFQGDIPHHEGIAKQLIDYRKATGDEPLWTNAVFSGMPAYLIDVQYQEPLNTLFKTLFAGSLPSNVGYILTAMLGFYILLLSFGVQPYVAIAGGIAYGLSTFTLVSIGVGHDGKVAAMAWMPLVLAGVRVAYQHHRWWGAALTAVGLSLEIAATHPQITYYLALMLAMYGLSQLIAAMQEKKLGSFVGTSVVLGIAVLWAIGANFGRLWTVYEYSPYSIRGSSALQAAAKVTSTGLDKDYVFRWSLGKAETMTLLIPNFYGGSSREQLSQDSYVGKALQHHGLTKGQAKPYLQHMPTYWGNQPFTQGPMYLGAITCFLYLVGLWSVQKQHRYWLLASTVLAILLAWGKNWPVFNDWMYRYFPGYNKFRAVTTAIVMAQVATGLLACLTLQQLLDRGFTPAIRKGLQYAAVIMGSILLLGLFLAGLNRYEAPGDVSLPPWLAQALRADRKVMLQKDALRALFFILATGIVLSGYGWKKLRANQVALGLVLLILADYYGVGKRYVRSASYQTQTHIDALDVTPARQYIQQDTTLGYRVLDLNNPFNDGRTSYYHQAIGGYHGAKLRRYQDLIEYCLRDECAQIMSYKQAHTDRIGYLPVLNMLNTRYLITSHQQEGVITNPHALGPAWFVHTLQPVGSPLEEITALKTIHPQHTAVIDTTQFSVAHQPLSGQRHLTLTAYRPNYLQYEAETSTGGLAVFAEVYYPKGWQAWLDGQAVNHVRVNYILRALAVPAGKHTITFTFAPRSYRLGNQVMLATAVLMIVLLAVGGIYQVQRWAAGYLSTNHRKLDDSYNR